MLLASLLLIGVLLGFLLSRSYPAPPRAATITVAAYDSSKDARARADYVADGVSDEVEIEAAISRVNKIGGGLVLLSEGTFVLSQPIVAYRHDPLIPIYPFQLEGSGAATVLDGRALEGYSHIIDIYGATLSEPQFRQPPLAADAQEGQSSIKIADAAEFSVGQHIMISSDRRYGANFRGELQRIRAIEGNTIFLQERLFDDYLVADSAKVTRKLLAENITLSDFRIVADRANRNAAISVNDAANITIHDVTIANSRYAGIVMRNTIFSRISSSRIEGSSLKGEGYAISIQAASRNNTVYGNTMTDSIKAITVGGGPAIGITRFTNVHGNNASNVDYGFETHGESDYTIFASNIVSNTYGHAFAASDGHVKIVDNIVKNHNNNGTSSDAAIVAGTGATDVEIVGNTLTWNPQGTSGQEWGILVEGTAREVAIAIRNNHLYGYAIGIRVLAKAVKGGRITGNIIRNPIAGGYGIHIKNQAGKSKDISIGDNDIDGNGKLAAGIVVEASKGARIDKLRIANNDAYNNTRYGIVVRAEDGPENVVRDVIITGNALYDDQAVPTQDYGGTIEGNVENVIIRMNIFGRNRAGSLFLQGLARTSPTVNIGDNSEN